MEKTGLTLDRRHLLKAGAAASGVAALASASTSAAANADPPDELIDVNVNLSRWPFRRLRGDDTASLVAMLQEKGVTQAWAGSYDGLLQSDIAAVNTRLAEECQRYGKGILVPFGSINPTLPDWEDDLRRCAEEHRMPGIRLHPNYHGYQLDDPIFKQVLGLAAERGLIVQMALLMEDPRTAPPILKLEPTDYRPLAGLIKETPGLRFVLSNALKVIRKQALSDLVEAGDVSFDIGTLEGIGGVGNLLAQIPLERVLFGSHAPFFYFESALLKLRESPLVGEQLRAIRHGNARRLLAANR